MNKEDIIKYLEDLNQYEYIKINGTDKKRLIFKNCDDVFNIFGAEEKGVLNPFNDYTYEWLSSFLNNVIDLLKRFDFDTFEELQNEIQDNISKWADSETDVYTYNLTEWLHDNNNNVYYLDEVLKEYGQTDNILMKAQYMAIDELFNNALSLLIEDLKNNFDEDE